MSNMKVAIYARVSTEDQLTENQTEELVEYVTNHRQWELYKTYTDKITGTSGKRPGLDSLMQDARRRKFNHVVFWKVDRLARDSLVFFQVLQEWENLEITFSVASLGVDTNTSHGKFVVGILEQVAELERKDIVDKTNLALKRIKRNIDKKGFHITKDGKRITRLGRPPGKKDSGPRRKSGYYERWAGK